jgi:hypothetical protein
MSPGKVVAIATVLNIEAQSRESTHGIKPGSDVRLSADVCCWIFWLQTVNCKLQTCTTLQTANLHYM